MNNQSAIEWFDQQIQRITTIQYDLFDGRWMCVSVDEYNKLKQQAMQIEKKETQTNKQQ